MCLTCDITKECAEHFELEYNEHILVTNDPKVTALKVVYYLPTIWRNLATTIIQNPNSIEIRILNDVSCKDLRNNAMAARIMEQFNGMFYTRINNELYSWLYDGEGIERIMQWLDNPYVSLVLHNDRIVVNVNGEKNDNHSMYNANRT